MWSPINWGIVKQPLNWVIVLLMVLIAAFAFDVITRGLHMSPPSNEGN